MATPAKELIFRKIFGSLGNFGGTQSDVSRPGIDGHAFKYGGKRGALKQVLAVQYFPDFATANQFRQICHAAQSFETRIVDILDKSEYRVMLIQVDAAEPIRIESSEAGINFKVEVTLNAIRTL